MKRVCFQRHFQRADAAGGSFSGMKFINRSGMGSLLTYGPDF